jgi:hypothetical protein
LPVPVAAALEITITAVVAAAELADIAQHPVFPFHQVPQLL